MIAKRRGVWEKPREEGVANKSDNSGRTSKRRKRSANLSCPLGDQVMIYSLWSDKGRNLIQGGMKSKTSLSLQKA